MTHTAPASERIPVLNCSKSTGFDSIYRIVIARARFNFMDTNHGFLEQALIYLAAGIIAVPIFRRLGLGAVLGYLVAGVAIAPWGLRLVADPRTVPQIAEFGRVLLL